MKNTYFLIFALFAAFGLSSCLKSLNDVNLGDIPSVKLFEISPNDNPSLGAADRVYAISYGILATPQTLKIPVYLNTTAGTYLQDVTVTLVKDTAAISAYNAADTTGNTNFQFLPDSTFTTTTPLTVIVPAGQKFGYLVVNITSSKVDLFSQYMLSYKIVGVPAGSLISDTRASVQYKVAIKNKYDGYYSDRFELRNWAAYHIISDGKSHLWPNNVGAETSGPNTIVVNTGAAGSGTYNQPQFGTTLNANIFGATHPEYTFDLATNKVTGVANLSPDDGRGRSFHLNPAITDSRYDPSSQIIYVAYIMTQNGRPDQEIYDTLTYQGPR